jgi:hypothetical protein
MHTHNVWLFLDSALYPEGGMGGRLYERKDREWQ